MSNVHDLFPEGIQPAYFDFSIERGDDWQLPEPLPFYEACAANEARKPSWWERFCAKCDAVIFGEYGNG
jgi:hypothetical protein